MKARGVAADRPTPQRIFSLESARPPLYHLGRVRRSFGLYAVRDSKGRFKDIQTYKRAHDADIKRSGKAEARGKKKTKRDR